MGRRGGVINCRCLLGGVPARASRAGRFTSPAYHGPGNEDLVGASNAVMDGSLEEFICFLFACAVCLFFPCVELVTYVFPALGPTFPYVEGRVFKGSGAIHHHLQHELHVKGCAAYAFVLDIFYRMSVSRVVPWRLLTLREKALALQTTQQDIV